MEQATNPKEERGARKPDLSLIPTTPLLELCRVMRHGSAKYGVASWRHDKVAARTYIAAAMRHLLAWADGSDSDYDSGAHPLAHVAACAFIALDAEANGMMIDNRLGKIQGEGLECEDAEDDEDTDEGEGNE